MKALLYSRFGEPAEVVGLTEVDDPNPADGFVLVKVLRSPIHNHDLATIRGSYGVKPELPAIGGSELLGLADGRRVVSMVRGAWAEYVAAGVDAIVPVPDAIPDDEAAQLLAMPLSTVVLFDSLDAKAGDWIVQNAANGAVGRILMRLAQSAGVNVVNLVRRAEAAEQMRQYGARHVVVTGDADWPQRVRELTDGAPIARVVDSICDANSTELNRLLGPLGEHVVFGALAGRKLALDPGAVIFGQTQVRGFWVSTWMVQASPADVRQAIGRVFGLWQAGELPLRVAGVYPLEDAARALREAETPGRSGKVLFRAG
ncbi:MAG TPA: zinc-binding dehydrogenase [Candidatus Acidoferrales bacterium]|nr:zinc-binding dehydrogenase [Candidatus Acidoferrales bacterium]